MARTITHFMWGYQQLYRVNRKIAADHIFKQLDDRFQPDTFLVGILDPKTGIESFPACVEPEEDYWIQSEDLDNTLNIAATLQPTYPESQMLISHPRARHSNDDYLFRRSIRDAIHTTLEQHPERAEGIEYFASIPERVGSYLVSVVIGLQQEVLSSYYSLNRSSVPIHEYRHTRVARSLIDASITEFFSDSAEELRKPDPGYSELRREAEDSIRSAGRQLTRDIAFRADPNSFGWDGLFRAFNTISSLRYEKAAGIGRIVVTQQNHQAIRTRINFNVNLKMANFRGARKLLQLSTHGSGLHSNSVEVFGLADVEGYTGEEEDLFEVHFLDHHHWALLHAGHVLMRVRYGQPYLVKPPSYEAKLPKDLPRIFKGISEKDIELLVSLVQQAEKESHGTLLVITPEAQAEAVRLRGQSIAITPQQLTPEILGQLTSIDGAVMIDPEGYCHAVGVILDGIAQGEGDSARGARYNSALRYTSSSNAPCLALVVSEDGGVDLVPNLLPAVSRAKVDAAMRELTNISQLNRVPFRRYNYVLGWLEQHSFYLLEDDCESINQWVRAIEDRMDQEEPMRTKLVRTPFVANPEMDVELYYEPDL